MAKTKIYYMCEGATYEYGGYETFEDAMKQLENDGEVKRVIKVTEITEEVYIKPDYQIGQEEVLRQLHNSFTEDDVKDSYLSKDAIKFLIDLLEKDNESSKNSIVFPKNATNGDIIDLHYFPT